MLGYFHSRKRQKFVIDPAFSLDKMTLIIREIQISFVFLFLSVTQASSRTESDHLRRLSLSARERQTDTRITKMIKSPTGDVFVSSCICYFFLFYLCDHSLYFILVAFTRFNEITTISCTSEARSLNESHVNT